MQPEMQTYQALMEIRKENAIGLFSTHTITFEAPYPYKVPKSNLYDVAIREARAQGYETLIVYRVVVAD
jgi:hypothetical protein